jgi:hypothetical protein
MADQQIKHGIGTLFSSINRKLLQIPSFRASRRALILVHRARHTLPMADRTDA